MAEPRDPCDGRSDSPLWREVLLGWGKVIPTGLTFLPTLIELVPKGVDVGSAWARVSWWHGPALLLAFFMVRYPFVVAKRRRLQDQCWRQDLLRALRAQSSKHLWRPGTSVADVLFHVTHLLTDWASETQLSNAIYTPSAWRRTRDGPCLAPSHGSAGVLVLEFLRRMESEGLVEEMEEPFTEVDPGQVIMVHSKRYRWNERGRSFHEFAANLPTTAPPR